jgi:spoIIIJ-associated protein
MQREGTTQIVMSEPKRRFFSGDSLQQALVQAANHFNLDPEEIAYRSIEKRHGFLKVRRKVMIEVNPDAPKREAGAPRPAPAAAPPSPAAAPAASAPPPDLPRAAPAVRPEPRDEDDDNRGNRIGRDDRGVSRAVPDDRGNRVGRGEQSQRSDRGGRGDRSGGDRGDRGRRGEGRGSEDPRRHRSAAPRYAREERTPESGAVAAVAPAGSGAPEGLVNLPDTPRRPSERFPPATGPLAEAANRGVELLLRIAGLDLTPRILQGEDRLEVDLSGADVDWCFADDGELVMAVEHLLPRLIRTLSGESTLVRVDCDNFQEIREERLRSLAQRVAEEVRRRGKSHTLEPMNPADRRIVHMTLADDPGVMTESEGDGYFKRINVRPA